ncbi:FxDxF family PEP-CTERM protein [Nitrogeniibacter mangrovi]|nr:FxDxF family PEP-CTERM protein [Nitrogeniibacter mangrovi]
MKRRLITLAIPLAMSMAGSAHAALFDTFEGLSHSDTEGGFVSGDDLLAGYSFDFTLSEATTLTFSGESSFDFASLGLYDGGTLLRGWLLTPTSGSDVTTFSLAAGDYSFKTIASMVPGTASLTSTDGYYAFQSAVVAAVPEPASYGMLLAGLGMLSLVARRKLNDAA